jgi:hypothetical protein
LVIKLSIRNKCIFSNFIGAAAGNGATNANYSNFGYYVGIYASNANNQISLVIAGYSATSASNSNFIGYR